MHQDITESDLNDEPLQENDCSELPQQSGSDLNMRVDPETGKLIDEWFEWEEFAEMCSQGDIVDEEILDDDPALQEVDTDDEVNWGSDNDT